MSNNYIESLVGDNGKILIEIGDSGGAVGFGAGSSAPKAQNKTKDAFNQALKTVRLAASSVLETLNTLDEKPSTARVDFGIKFNNEAKAMLSNGGSDAQLRVSLTWNTSDSEGKNDEAEA